MFIINAFLRNKFIYLEMPSECPEYRWLLSFWYSNRISFWHSLHLIENISFIPFTFYFIFFLLFFPSFLFSFFSFIISFIFNLFYFWFIVLLHLFQLFLHFVKLKTNALSAFKILNKYFNSPFKWRSHVRFTGIL